MFARTNSQASRGNFAAWPVKAAPPAQRMHAWVGFAVAVSIAAASWVGSGHLLGGWQFF
jgi:hypothetical protein